MKLIILSKYLSIVFVTIVLAACSGGGSSGAGDDGDKTPPDTNIISTPSTNSTSATFSFTATEEEASFECHLNSRLFTACNSPIHYENLAEGNHSFSVRATDLAGNTDPAPAIYRWVIDSIPPDTNIISIPSTAPTSATFSFIATEESASFECRLDSRLFTTCNSPIHYENLAEGSHSFSVRATDVVGNVGAAAIFRWEIQGDPLYSLQWHLKNTGQWVNVTTRGKAGEDINVEPAWNNCIDSSCRGEGVRIVVVDDGIEMTHEDLKENVVPDKSYDYVDQDTEPPPGDHGTSVAGIIAARDFNGFGVRGVAPHAELVGYNLLKAGTSANISDAMTRDAAQNHVSNNSWGPMDGTGLLIDSSAVWRTAIDTGHRIGRGGRGTVYVFAAGNGHTADNSNYSGYANYRGVIAVGAVNHLGQRSSYSERGANLLVSAPGGEGGGACNLEGIVTTDRTGRSGYTDSSYTTCFAGTSAAAPMLTGVVALILQASPDLGWRDVHAILARSTRKNDVFGADWQTNGAGLHVNHDYGFGVVDAEAAVSLAKNWINLEPEKEFSTPETSVDQEIGNNDGVPVRSTLSVASSEISNIEFVEIRFSADDHTYSGDLEITLINLVTGTTSRLAETHRCMFGCIPYNSWRFGSTRHLGESADGDWQLIVEDKSALNKGTFQSWKLTFYGT